MKLKDRLRSLFTIGNAVALLLLALSVAAFWWLRTHPDLNVFSEDGLVRLVKGLGWWGPLAYIAIVALTVVVSQLPGVPLAIAAGALWGPLTAGLYSVLGGFLGGMIAYFFGRTLGRSAMQALTGKVMTFQTTRGERYLGWLIFVTRLLPVLSFDIISYAAGVSGLSVGVYAAATLFGMIPSTLLLTYLGSVLGANLSFGLALSVVAAALVLLLPWLVQRYNLFDLRESFKLE